MRTLKVWAAWFAVGCTVASSALAQDLGGAGPIDPVRLSAEVKVLGSEAYQGRAPGTEGERLTIAHLVKQLTALGLEPAGDHGGFLQTVPLVKTEVLPGAAARLEIGAGARTLTEFKDIYLNTTRPTDRVTIANAPMIFVGYGVDAPERGWDDYKGVDLHGKIAVYLVNDPDFEALPSEPVAGKFGGKAMTYYGRWTYKYEEAGRRGALGALIIHETPGAGYDWSTVIAPRGETYDVIRPDGGRERPALQGWIPRTVAEDLFKAAGMDFEALKVSARGATFRPVEIPGARFSADFHVAHETVTSHNVLAKLTGASRPDEAVMFGAHWDAFGIAPRPNGGPVVIRPGANDDGLGVAGVLELARAFKAGPRPARTLLFGLWAAEERGLLGSEYFAQHPTFPLDKLAADYTIDILQTAGLAHDVVLVGAGQNELEVGLARAAAVQGRTVTPDTHPERGLFYRADHFSLAKRGVPVLLLTGNAGGADLLTGGRVAGEKWVSDYAHCYHRPCDAWSADWDLRGAAQDVDLLYLAGGALANSPAWPAWNAESEFRPIRQVTAAARN